MDLSIIMLTWNSQRYLERCLRSLTDSLHGTGLEYEILVVDNGSADSTPPLLRRFVEESPDRIFAEFLPDNLGTTVPRNRALRRARGEFLCVVDSDVETCAEVFTHLREVLSRDATIGLVAPRIHYPGGKLQKSYDKFPTMLHKVNRFFRLRTMEAREGGEAAKITGSRDVDYAISAFWMFHRRLLQSVGFLDEKIFYSPEDVDYCLRVWKSNYRIVYVPAVSVVHHTQEISRGWKLNRAKLSHLKGLIYLFFKHRYFFAPPVFCSGPPAAEEKA